MIVTRSGQTPVYTSVGFLAIKKGNFIIVTSFSYLTPLLSTLFSCLYLQVPNGYILWLAGGLVVAGSVICRYSVSGRE